MPPPPSKRSTEPAGDNAGLGNGEGQGRSRSDKPSAEPVSGGSGGRGAAQSHGRSDRRSIEQAGGASGGGAPPQGLSRSGSLPACSRSSEMRRTRSGPSPFELATRPNTIPKATPGRPIRKGLELLSQRPPSAGQRPPSAGAGQRPPSAGRRPPSTTGKPGSAKHQKIDEPFVLVKPSKLPTMVGYADPRDETMVQVIRALTKDLGYSDPNDDAVVHVFGEWTAHEDLELGLVFVHTASGRVQTTPPPELLEYLEEEDRVAQDDQEADQTKPEAKYQRIFMRVDKNVPQLLMAKDMVAALRQGSTPFEAIQQRFSDACEEGLLSLHHFSSEEVATSAKALKIGQVSDPIVDEAGVHILMRAS